MIAGITPYNGGSCHGASMQSQCPPDHFCVPPVPQSHALTAGIAGGVVIGIFGRSLSHLVRWAVAKARLIAPKQVDATPIPNALLAIADLIAGDLDAVARDKFNRTLVKPEALAYLVQQPPETVQAVIQAVDTVAHDPSQMPRAIAELAVKNIPADAIALFLKQ